jgi:hypothetical protein
MRTMIRKRILVHNRMIRHTNILKKKAALPFSLVYRSIYISLHMCMVLDRDTHLRKHKP